MLTFIKKMAFSKKSMIPQNVEFSHKGVIMEKFSIFLDSDQENSDLGLLFTAFRAKCEIYDFMMKIMEIIKRF